jgi:selenocysteine-specific elongation factor
VIAAAERAGEVVRVAPDLVVKASLVARAEKIVRETGAEGITAGEFKQRLGTTRRYAIPLLEWLDRRGLTRREGDRRFGRGN